MKFSSAFMMAVLAALALASATIPAQEAPSSRPAEAQSSAQQALSAAEHGGKFAFIVFWKEDNAAAQQVRQTLDAALARRAGRAVAVPVRVGDPEEKAIVDRFAVSRSPMPMVVALAPNGAITGGFALKLTEEDVSVAFVSPGMAGCLKATQARKLVLLCVQPAGGGALPEGVSEIEADAQYGPATEVVTVRADDPAEAGLLSVFGVTPKAGVVTTVLIGASGKRLATFEGAFKKAQVIEKLKSGQGGCCPGGKCGPDGKCG